MVECKVSIGDRVRLSHNSVSDIFKGCYATVSDIQESTIFLDIELADGSVRRGIRCAVSSQHLITVVDEPMVSIAESQLDLILFA